RADVGADFLQWPDAGRLPLPVREPRLAGRTGRMAVDPWSDRVHRPDPERRRRTEARRRHPFCRSRAAPGAAGARGPRRGRRHDGRRPALPAGRPARRPGPPARGRHGAALPHRLDDLRRPGRLFLPGRAGAWRMTDAAIPTGQADPSARGAVTPEGVLVHVRLARVGERVAALTLDIVFLIAALIVVTIATFAAGGHLGIAAGIVLMFLLRAFYFTGFELAWNGQTPGKRISGLRVVNRYGGPLAPAAVIGRNLMREGELFLPLSLVVAGAALAAGPWTYGATVVWVGVLVALPLFNRDRLRAGDMVAGTWVVAEPKPVLLRDLASASAASGYQFTMPQLVVYGVKELQ